MGKSSWFEHYVVAKKYYDLNGHLVMSTNYMLDGLSIGRWVSNQRHRIKVGSLDSYQVELLEDIGINLPHKDLFWEEKYKLLKDYYDKYGDLHINYDFIIKGFRLGHYLYKQTKLYNSGKLSIERMRQLEKIGLITDYDEYRFEIGYSKAAEYYKKFNHLLVPSIYDTEDSFALGNWIICQRKKYIKGTLDDDRLNRLLEIGFIPDVLEKNRLVAEREKKVYDLFKSYGFKIRSNDIISRYPIDIVKKIIEYMLKNDIDIIDDNKNLNPMFYVTSCEELKEKYNVNIISKSLSKKRNKKRVLWTDYFRMQIEYVNKNGEEVPEDYEVDGIKLGEWVAYNKKKSVKKKKIEIIGLGTITSYNDLLWNKKYKVLIKYYNQYGNLDVSNDCVFEGVHLKKFIDSQIVGYKKGKLSEDRYLKLKKINLFKNIKKK